MGIKELGPMAMSSHGRETKRIQLPIGGSLIGLSNKKLDPRRRRVLDMLDAADTAAANGTDFIQMPI